MFPVRCYTCGFVYDAKDPQHRGKTLEEAAEIDILKGVPIDKFMDNNKIVRMCCRLRVVGMPFIVQLQKEAANNRPSEIEKAIANLNSQNTGSQHLLHNLLSAGSAGSTGSTISAETTNRPTSRIVDSSQTSHIRESESLNFMDEDILQLERALEQRSTQNTTNIGNNVDDDNDYYQQ